MKALVRVLVLVMLVAPVVGQGAKPGNIDGDWKGTLNAGGATLRLVLHITTDEAGMKARVDSPDQNTYGLPVTAITRDGTTVQFDMKPLAASFRGTLDQELTTIDGAWTQAGSSLALVFNRVRKAP